MTTPVAAGSYFELVDGVMTLARLDTPELPSYVRDNLSETKG